MNNLSNNVKSVNPKVGKMYVDESEQRVGFTPFAELWNGRLAMIGFSALLLIEVFSGKGLLTLLHG